MKIILTLLFFFTICSLVSAQDMPRMSMKDTLTEKKKEMKDIQDEMMLPMPFFTHMGMPLDVGSYNFRLAALPTQNEGATNMEFNAQFMTGLSKTVGLMVGGSGSFDAPTLEVMFQFLTIKSKNGMNGFSPIIEFEFPLGKEATRKVYTLVGFATTLSNSKIAFNQVLHYSPLEDLAEGSASVVIKLAKNIFFVSEVSGVTEKGQRPMFNLLGGVKIKVHKYLTLGFGYQQPFSSNKEFTSQYIFQTSSDWKR
jgi:hypothetical protein